MIKDKSINNIILANELYILGEQINNGKKNLDSLVKNPAIAFTSDVLVEISRQLEELMYLFKTKEKQYLEFIN